MWVCWLVCEFAEFSKASNEVSSQHRGLWWVVVIGVFSIQNDKLSEMEIVLRRATRASRLGFIHVFKVELVLI